jgi:hypothetical protein
MAKIMTDSELVSLAYILETQLLSAATAWEIAMKCLPVGSKEYRRICRAGNEIQQAYVAIRDLAGSRWDTDQMNRHFTIKEGYSFS